MDVDEDGGNATENGIMDVPLPQEAPCVAQPQSHSQVAVSPSAASASDVSMESLFSKFGCMQTLDRKDLIEQVRRLVGDNITDEAAVFYLEMNQFNVAAAVGSYFDLEAGAEAKATPPQMMFVRDVTIGEGESVPPNTMFIKTWQPAAPLDTLGAREVPATMAEDRHLSRTTVPGRSGNIRVQMAHEYRERPLLRRYHMGDNHSRAFRNAGSHSTDGQILDD